MKKLTFQEIILKLQDYWHKQGCLICQPYDIEKGAGTFNPHTFFGVLGKKPHRVAYVEPSRRPTDGRYGDNPNRVYEHHQFQVIIKPVPDNIQDIYLKSLEYIGIELDKHDIRFVEDDWESPTLGATGLGWEIWLDGMEITQYTYFQHVGGFDLEPVSVELTYGLERIAMFLQGKDSVFDIDYGTIKDKPITYRDLRHEFEYEFSKYTFEIADIPLHFELFNCYEKEFNEIIKKELVLPAYDYVLKASHTFNVLDARNAISVTERVGYIARIRNMAKKCAELYMEKYEN
jgi:glycyl-tRNA synthetase alpha chain